MKKKEYADPARAQAFGTAIIIVVLLLVLTLISLWMYHTGLLVLPGSIARFFGIEDETPGEISWDLGELSEIIRDERHPDVESVTLERSIETLHAAFLSEQAAPGFSVSARVSYFDDGEKVPHRVLYRRSGNQFRADVYAGDDFRTLKTLKIGTGDSLFIYDMETGFSRSLPIDANFSSEYEAGIPSVAEILRAVETFPIATDGTAEASSQGSASSSDPEFTDCELKLVKTAEDSVYYVKFTYADLGIKEEYYVSLDYGIVLSATTSHGDMPVYSYEALSFSVEPSNWDNPDYYNPITPS